jgi:hypothetical protein
MALVSPATMAGLDSSPAAAFLAGEGIWDGDRDAPVWVCARGCRMAELRLRQGHRWEQAAAPASAFCPWQ